MAGQRIVIPYSPRPVQREVHKRMLERRFVVLVAHRRMGKTVLAVNHLIRRALTEGKERGVYGYIAPFRNQSKAIAWEYLKHYTAPVPGREVNEGDLSVMLPSGARIRLFGADNPDALRGLYFDGVVLDEVAQMRPEVWQEIVRPALADRRGWAVFIGTPKGVNLFHELYLRACKDEAEKGESSEWSAMIYRATETGALDADELDKMRAEMTDNAWRQEMLCDFSSSADDVLIPVDLSVEAAARVKTEADVRGLPIIIGVDVARFGSDASVFFRRSGLVAYPPLVLRGLDNMAVADRLVATIHEHKPDAVFIDAGQGQGVIDRVRQLGCTVTEIPFGGRAMAEHRFVNRRSEMWYAMREWLVAGGSVPNDSRLLSELAAPLYSFNAAGKIELEPKPGIVKRLGYSPDLADALALTFAAPVVRMSSVQQHVRARTEYDAIGWG